jgi:hypothetical protein
LKQLAPYLIIGIFIFHILATGYAFYSMFNPFLAWTFGHVYPFGLLLFTGVWFFILIKKRIAAVVYFMMVFTELMIKLFMGSYEFGKVLGSILFPIDLVFAFVILLLYKIHFGDRSTQS